MIPLLVLLTALLSGSAPIDPPASTYFEVETRLGSFVIKLYDKTPIHRENFSKLAADGFYDGTAFHRVIDGFMIQGGDPNSRDDDPYNDGAGDPGYTLESEIEHDLIHKRGAVAAARTGDSVNPERRSSGSQFYVVTGMTFDDATLDRVEQQVRQMTADTSFTFSAAARSVYREMGGAPNLDGQYTVFGEVVEGMEVVDALAAAETPRSTGRRGPPQLVDRPFEPLTMRVRPLPNYDADAQRALRNTDVE